MDKESVKLILSIDAIPKQANRYRRFILVYTAFRALKVIESFLEFADVIQEFY